MRRPPTAAQKEAARAKREAFRILARKIAGMSEDERQALVAGRGITNPEGRELSFKNTCLVISQRPDATVVGGFKQWLAAGRAVRKGEHGFTIWVPGAGPQTEAGDAELRFLTVTVFDIAQTQSVTEEAAA